MAPQEVFNSDQILQHWISCQTPTDPRYDAYIHQGKIIINKFKKWVLAEIATDEILNYQDSELENSGPLIEKINRFLLSLKNINDLPAIILIPVDINYKKPFIEHKYYPEVKWEIADGIHRFHLLLKLRIKKVKSYIPIGD